MDGQTLNWSALTARRPALRDEGKSIEAIAAEFTAEGYSVSRETIRRWLKRVGLPLRIAS